MDKRMDEKTLHAAADWWTRLRDPSEAARTVEHWLEWIGADDRHLEAFEQVTELGDRLGSLDDLTRQQFMREFARPVAVPPAASPRRWLPLAAAAAAVLVLVGSYVGWSRSGAQAVPQVYSSAIAQNRSVTLPDGSTVALGGASTLTTRFSHGERRVELGGGEAFFQVKHDAQRPFIVNAGTLFIRDVGTAFDVRRTGQRVSIAVTQGRVQIANNAGVVGSTDTGSLEAGAGELVSYDPATSAMSIGKITPEQATAWRSDRLEFIDEPLGVVIANVNRYSARPIHIADADLKALTFTGNIKTGAIDSWLSALPQVFPLRVSEDTSQVTLSDAEPGQKPPSPAKQ
ncbi:transmembrane sensor [Rhodanobacter sp. ANJX3]|uniref:FecR family protein n=1 Tax=Rhodanobacter sp. ANJX3 TaxID=2723083 RepID=UPI00161D6D9A|nr:FecR domain-containing protein [Rhodanobacter sp. ANJX3]MBB5360211.1 transmembrane sensor [Rhodanobacter sp. ANJX3]